MIHTERLERSFRIRRGFGPRETVIAVQGISMDISHGEIVALLGPNGAGKSTTLRMLSTLLRPSSGSAIVAGYDVQRQPDAVRRRIGYVGQGNGAGQYHRVGDELVTQGYFYGLTHKSARRRAGELLEICNLTALRTRDVFTLSGGQRRRLDIAMGLMHSPELLFLDEPSTGLDPQNRANLLEQVRGIRDRYGTTIVLSTHYMDEADIISDRVVIIDEGRIIANDTSSVLKASLEGDRILITFQNEIQARHAQSLAARITEKSESHITGESLHLQVAGGARLLPGLLREIDHANIQVVNVELRSPTLDDVFLTLTGRSLRDPEGEVA
jgi:ABC-2 type transport system ATP-binding protein